MGSVLANVMAYVPVFCAAFLIATGAIYAILSIKRILKERKMSKPSFAKSSVRSEALLDQLPKEILETIFEFLDARGSSTASTTSKYWNYVISKKGIKNRIFDDTIAALETSKMTLEQIVGIKLNDIWLKTRNYPASYPKQWIIQDYERWKIFDFTARAPVFPLRNLFAADPTLALRLRGRCKYNSKDEEHWRFQLEKNDPLERFCIRKQNTPGEFTWPYFPCENILEDGAKYELIVTMSCIVEDPQGPVPTVHQIRPLDGSAARTYTRIPRFRTLMLALGSVLLGMFLLDAVIWRLIKFAERPLPPMNLEEQSILCEPSSWPLIWVGSLLAVILVAFGQMKLFFKHMDGTNGLRARIIKAALWAIANYVVFNSVMIYFETFGWWFVQSALYFFIPNELAKHSQFMNDIKRRKATKTFGNLLTVGFICPIVFAFMIEDFIEGNFFSPLVYVIHVIFTVILYVYGRFAYVITLRLLDPQQCEDSPSLKKWFTWSLPVRWWVFVTLVGVPLTTSTCSCLGVFLWE